jgi:hypothetical protein
MMLRPNGTNLDVHVYMNVRDTDIKTAADTTAKHTRMRMPTKASDFWITRFQKYMASQRGTYLGTLSVHVLKVMSSCEKRCPGWVQVAVTLLGFGSILTISYNNLYTLHLKPYCITLLKQPVFNQNPFF